MFEINENRKDTLSKDDERDETEIEKVNQSVALKIETESNSSQKGNERTKKGSISTLCNYCMHQKRFFSLVFSKRLMFIKYFNYPCLHLRY